MRSTPTKSMSFMTPRKGTARSKRQEWLSIDLEIVIVGPERLSVMRSRIGALGANQEGQKEAQEILNDIRFLSSAILAAWTVLRMFQAVPEDKKARCRYPSDHANRCLLPPAFAAQLLHVDADT